MRIWDLAAGYLNRGSLLGEHRELHGIYSILTNGKTGYARHPETLRWAGAGSGLAVRHRQLVAEMRVRGYTDRTPLPCNASGAQWPKSFVTAPEEQVTLLRQKYARKPKGRIPLPRNAQELWAQHKYSVMARSPRTYQTIGRSVARMRNNTAYATLRQELTWILRDAPTKPAAERRRTHVGIRAGSCDCRRHPDGTHAHRPSPCSHSATRSEPATAIPVVIDRLVRARRVR
jgi:hypothetical protein